MESKTSSEETKKLDIFKKLNNLSDAEKSIAVIATIVFIFGLLDVSNSEWDLSSLIYCVPAALITLFIVSLGPLPTSSYPNAIIKLIISHKNLSICCTSILAISLFFVYIWPTPYIYTWDTKGRVIRTNRFTGVIEYSGASGWKKLSPNVQSPSNTDDWTTKSDLKEKPITPTSTRLPENPADLFK